MKIFKGFRHYSTKSKGDLLKHYAKSYYNDGVSLISDGDYDKLFEEYRNETGDEFVGSEPLNSRFFFVRFDLLLFLHWFKV